MSSAFNIVARKRCVIILYCMVCTRQCIGECHLVYTICVARLNQISIQYQRDASYPKINCRRRNYVPWTVATLYYWHWMSIHIHRQRLFIQIGEM